VSNFVFGVYADASYGYPDSSVYAVIHNEQEQALKLHTPSPELWILDDYTKITHESFCIQLTEHSERTGYYYKEFDTDLFTLPSTLYGKRYCIEYWYRDNEDAFDRDVDELINNELFLWDATYKRRVFSEIGQEQENQIATTKVVVSAVYDSVNLVVRIIGWLERAGQIVTDTKRLDIHWYAFDDTVITTAQKTVQQVNTPGVFAIELTGISVDPDYVTPIKATIVDSDDTEYTTVVSAATYD